MVIFVDHIDELPLDLTTAIRQAVDALIYEVLPGIKAWRVRLSNEPVVISQNGANHATKPTTTSATCTTK